MRSVAKQLNSTIRNEGLNNKRFFNTEAFSSPSSKSPFLAACDSFDDSLNEETELDKVETESTPSLQPVPYEGQQLIPYKYKIESYCSFRNGRFYASSIEYKLN